MDKNWLENYSRKVLSLKGIPDPSYKQLSNVTQLLEKSLKRPYHAIAIDVDGTITKKQGVFDIDSSIIRPLCDILRNYVPIVLMTGRGRKSARTIAELLRKSILEQDNNLSKFLFRRFHCVTHNGAFLLSSATELDIDFLKHESVLVNEEPFLKELESECNELFKKDFDAELTISREPVSIRIHPKETTYAKTQALHDRCLEIFEQIQPKYSPRLKHVKGLYGNTEVHEFTLAHKGEALHIVSKLLGIPCDYIIRIGDQGAEGYNDYDLLNSEYGFSVGSISESIKTCFPVLKKDNSGQLLGALGTAQLLELIKTAPAITLECPDSDLYYSKLLRFEQLAESRSRKEVNSWNSLISGRVRYLETKRISVEENQYRYFIDHNSGGVRFKEWDWSSIADKHPTKSLFAEKKQRMRGTQIKTGFFYSMLTDTSRILRGPFYYYFLSFDGKSELLDDYANECKLFIERVVTCLAGLNQRSLEDHLLLLGIMDNVRNLLLTSGYAIYKLLLEGGIKEKEPILNHYQILIEHTDYHLAELIDPFPESSNIDRYKNFLSDKLSGVLNITLNGLRDNKDKIVRISDYFRKWRETDNFLDNVLAINLAIHEFCQKIPLMFEVPVVVHGIAYGGFELPAICVAIAKRLGIKVFPTMIHHHGYKGKRIHPVQSKDNSNEPPLSDLPMINDIDIQPQYIHLLADDNLTTGRTIHLVRDRLEQDGKHVSGLIVVWYPSEKRFAQMQMRNHGGPDIDLFFTYIRGLIAPAPYTRFTQEGPPGAEYLDETGIFDKSRYRICRYLYRNNLYNSREVSAHVPRLNKKYNREKR